MTAIPAMPDPAAAEQPRSRHLAELTWLVALLYGSLLSFQVLVWNRVAAVPDRSLEQITLDLGHADDTGYAAFVFFVAAVLIGLATALVFYARRPSARALVTARLGFALIALGYPAYLLAAFPAGLALATRYGLDGGDHAAGGLILGIVSGLALLGFLALTAPGPWRRTAPVPAT